jgi:hypothetical protein
MREANLGYPKLSHVKFSRQVGRSCMCTSLIDFVLFILLQPVISTTLSSILYLLNLKAFDLCVEIRQQIPTPTRMSTYMLLILLSGLLSF